MRVEHVKGTVRSLRRRNRWLYVMIDCLRREIRYVSLPEQIAREPVSRSGVTFWVVRTLGDEGDENGAWNLLEQILPDAERLADAWIVDLNSPWRSQSYYEVVREIEAWLCGVKE